MSSQDQDRCTGTMVSGRPCYLPRVEGTDRCHLHALDREPTITQQMVSRVEFSLGRGHTLRTTLSTEPDGMPEWIEVSVVKEGEVVRSTGAMPGVAAFCGLREALDGLMSKVWDPRHPGTQVERRLLDEDSED